MRDGRTAPAEVEIVRAAPDRSLLRLTIHEGRKHQVKWMCLAVGLPVKRLRRIQIGPLTLGRLPKGAVRELTPQEVAQLRQAVGLPPLQENRR
ncbi:MAG: hypothetical protein KatS3mg115_0492 [Candidatus Poribacteria bacterium]|nr:MAG: hypothetical protein KatS3mg115_0492 [Candidatus Poribacteria bacterium]